MIEQTTDLPFGTLRRIAFDPDLLQPVITGQITDEMWRTAMIERLQTQFPQCDATSIIRQWSASVGEIDREILALIRISRQRVPVALITNATSRLLSDLDRLGIRNEFDHIINSSVVGVAKPDVAIFRVALPILQVLPEEALFVDDNPDHVLAAQQLGIHGHVYRGSEDLQTLLQQHVLL